MRTFAKSNRMLNVSYEVKGRVLEEAARMEANGDKVLKLNIGNPAPFGFEAPKEVMDAVRDGLFASQGYSDTRGVLEAREAIAAYCVEKGIRGVTLDNIFLGNGLSELIIICMQALLNDGDEILIPAPDYPVWTAAANLAGGNAVHYICDESSDWVPDIEDIRRKITSKTKAIVIVNPNNPTGAVYSRDVLEKIAALAREHELMIFSDEIYDRLIMDGIEHTSIASIAEDVCCVTLNGLSKSHLICGFRLGWICLSGRTDLASGFIEGVKVLASMRLCSNVPAQHAVVAALNHREETKQMFAPGGRVYKQREAICQGLAKIDGITFVRPQGGFYVFPKIDAKRFNIKDDERFVLDFLHAEKVLLLHGTGFSWPDPDHFRIVFMPLPEELTECAEKLGRFLSCYRQEN